MSHNALNTTNTTTNCETSYEYLRGPISYTFAILYSLCGIVAAAGNTVALIVLLQRQMRKKSNKLLLSLVVSDSLVGYAIMPSWVVELMIEDLWHNCLYRIVIHAASLFAVGSSSFAILFISYERYVLMTSNKHNGNHSSKKRSYISIAISWLIPLFGLGASAIHAYVSQIVIISALFAMLMMLLFTYIILTKTVNNKTRSIQSHNKQDIHKKLSNRLSTIRQVKLTRKVALLVAFYFICLVPITLMSIVDMVHKSVPFLTGKMLTLLSKSTFLVSATNSCINPIIYATKYPGFMACFRRMIKWKGRYRHKTSTK